MELLDVASVDRRREAVEQTADLLLRAGARVGAITGTRRRQEEGMSRREHARVLESLDLDLVELEVNRLLWKEVRPRIPRRGIDLAVDLNLQPYHGDFHACENELYRGEAKSGTTWFHAYATLYIVHRNRRYTLSVLFVRGDETSTDALMELLTDAMRKGLRPRVVYADKGFCTVDALAWLRENVPAFVVPLSLRGTRAKALCRGKGSYWATHTFHERAADALTVKVAVVVKRNGKRYHGRKPGNQYFPYIAHGLDSSSPKRIDRLYRNRAGIESSYRLVNRARPRTSSRNPAIRLVNYATAVFLQNAWVHLRWLLSEPRRGRTGRDAPKGFFAFPEYLELVAARLRILYGEVLRITQLPRRT